MQLQRICNHPDLINPRFSSSSYVSEALEYGTASLILKALESDLWKVSGKVNFKNLQNLGIYYGVYTSGQTTDHKQKEFATYLVQGTFTTSFLISNNLLMSFQNWVSN